MGAAFLLLVWGVAQQFVTGTVQRRVRIAEAGRRCLLQATMAVEEGIDLVRLLANEADEDRQSLSLMLRRLRPGQVLEFGYQPPLAGESADGISVEIEAVKVRALVQTIEPSQGPPPASFSCDRYRVALERWMRERLSPLALRREERALYRGWHPAVVKGLIEFAAAARTDVSGVRITKRLRVRRQFRIQVAPCPKELAAVTGQGLGSMMEINPVEISRLVETDRQPVPRRKP
jgi:hypothetical protein